MPKPGACSPLRPVGDGPRRQGRAARRIIFLNRFFFPDHSATSQILGDLAFHLAGGGDDVRVVTSRQRYDDPQAGLPETEAIGGVRIHRLATTRFGRSALLGRGFDYLSFYRSAWRLVLASAQPGDILVAKTDPPLLCLPAMQAAKRRSLCLVNWLQDLYPEVAMRLGVPLMNGPVGRALVGLRDTALRAAEANVVVGESMAEILRTRGIAANRIHVIPNWCDDQEVVPLGHRDNPLRREWGLLSRFVVGYSGNLGRAHEFETALRAAEHLRDNPDIVFLCVGGGNKLGELARRAKERRLEHLFRFFPYQQRSALKHSLGVADLHWISLKPELEGLIVPSKFYGVAAAGRPIIAVTAKDGELARLIRRHECGVVVEPGDGRAFGDALLRLSAEPERLARMGARARAMLDEHFSRRRAFERWRSLLARVASSVQQ
ncbi:MAG TPA: glycosyltransferase family 4 protein [Stellaceae bacterium]|nr:glycosyltransferase family 4 protein [Stellaceae bacterium]